MNQDEFDKKNGFHLETKSFVSSLSQSVKDTFTISGIQNVVKRKLPILHWLPKYTCSYAVSDFAAGITLAIYNVPQAMAYSVLAGLPPVYGLYVSFFSPLLFCIFGSSRHVSVGVFSITCLMAYAARSAILPDKKIDDPNYSYHGLTGLTPENIVTSLTLLTGFVQFILAACRLDFVMRYLSDSAVSGLIFGAAIQSLIAQLPNLLGIKLQKDNRVVFKLFYQFIEICEKLGDANIATVIVSTVALTVLIFSKTFIEKKKLSCVFNINMPFPTELVVIVIMTAVSFGMDLHGKYNVKIVSSVPKGFPPFSVPRFDIMPYLIYSSLSMAVVSYVITLSLSELFSKKHRYSICRRQELFALSFTNIISSFFQVFPSSGSLSRTLVNEGSGAKTQVSGLVSCVCLLSVILWSGKFLEQLPLAVLSCIVIVAIRSLLFKIKELRRLIKFSKIDAAVWVATAVTTISFDIIPGLFTGIVVGLFLVAGKTMFQETMKLGKIDTTFCDLDRYKMATNPRFQILRFQLPIIFTNVESFKTVMQELSVEIALQKYQINSQSNLEDLELDKTPTKEGRWSSVILDCSTWTHTDAMGVDALIDANENFERRNVMLLLANVGCQLRQQYKNAGVFKKLQPYQFYPTLADATIAAEKIAADEETFFRVGEELNIRVC